MRTYSTLSKSLCLAAGLFALCAEAVVVRSTTENLSKNASEPALWKDAEIEAVDLVAQPGAIPMPKETQTEKAELQALSDGKWIAVRVSWSDTERSEDGPFGKFSDGVALQFPRTRTEEPPNIMMGEAGAPVHIVHWKTAFQRDAEKGMKRVGEIYPNMAIDMYPMEYKNGAKLPKFTQEQINTYSHGRAAGNPQSSPKTRGVDEIVAEGFGSSQVIEKTEAYGRGEWKDGKWSVVIAKPIAQKSGSVLDKKNKNFMALAIWQGGKNEVGSRKSVTLSWIELLWKKEETK